MAQQPEFNGNTYRELPELDAWTSQRREAALEPDLAIIDPHHHLWDDQHRGRYLIQDLRRDFDSGHNVVATVYVESGSMYRADGPAAMQPVGEVEFANGVAAMSASGHYGASRVCAAIVGHADLRLGDQVQPVLEALIAAGNGRFRGIRHGMAWDSSNVRAGKRAAPPHLALDPTFRRGFARLQPLGLSFDAGIFHPQLPELADLLRAFPDTNVILIHVGWPLGTQRDEVFAIWRDHMRELAQFPNLSVKLGGLGMPVCGWDFHLRDMPPSSEQLAVAWRPYIETCIELFGPGRCMMESNFPVDKQSCGHGVLWNALKRITQNYSAAEKAALYHDTAARIYRLASDSGQ